MNGFIGDIEDQTETNRDFRRVLFTGQHMQLVVMSLQSGEELGEGHDGGDGVEAEPLAACRRSETHRQQDEGHRHKAPAVRRGRWSRADVQMPHPKAATFIAT